MKYTYVRILRTLFWLTVMMTTANLSCHSAPVKSQNTPLIESPSTGAAATSVAGLGPAVPISSAASPSSKSAATLMARPLTSAGINSQARFSPDGSRILFVSQERPSHLQAQVYELHIGLMKEKRVTFHDGDDSGPMYLPGGENFLFTSSTDAVKQVSFVSQRMMKTYLPGSTTALSPTGEIAVGPLARHLQNVGSDLFEQPLNGRTIERLTNPPDSSVDPDVDAKGKKIIFSSRREDRFLNLVVLNGRTQTHLTNGKFNDRGARYSPDGGSVVFSRQLDPHLASSTPPMAPLSAATPAPSSADGQIIDGLPASSLLLIEHIGQLPVALTPLGAWEDLEPAWSHSGDVVLFSSNRDGKFFNLYVVDRKGTCLKRLTNVGFDQLEPAFSPDDRQIVFTGNRDGRDQIYVMDFHKPEPCLPPAQSTPIHL